MSNFSFSHSVFKRLPLQTCKNQGLFGKGLNFVTSSPTPTLTETETGLQPEIGDLYGIILASRIPPVTTLVLTDSIGKFIPPYFIYPDDVTVSKKLIICLYVRNIMYNTILAMTF